MAGIVQIVLKVLGDVKDAVTGLDDITNAAKRTEDQAKRTDEALAKIGSNRRASAAGGVGGGVGDLGALGTQLGGIGGVVATIISALERMAGIADQITNREPQQDVSRAVSARDTAHRLESAGGTRFGDVFDWHNWTHRGLLFGGDNWHARQRVENEIAALAQSNPAQLAGSIPYLDPARAAYAQEQLTRAGQVSSYQTSLRAPSRGATAGQGQVNIYNQLPPGYDPRYLNRGMDTYNRVNGRNSLST